MIFTRILDPNSKRSSFKSAQSFLEAPSYELHDIYRALNVLAEECDFIQSEAYKNSHFVTKRCDKILQNYEDKLHLVERFMRIRSRVEQLKQLTNDSEMNKDKLIEEIESLSSKILEEL